MRVQFEGLKYHCQPLKYFDIISQIVYKKADCKSLYLLPVFPYHIVADNDVERIFIMNNIIKLLSLEDPSVTITDVSITNNIKTVTIEKNLQPVFCPCCGCRMHSRGVKTRTVNYPALQDGYSLILKVRQRRWKCPSCKLDIADDFKFLQKYRQSTNITDLLILQDMRNLSLSVRYIAEKFNVSDTYVHQAFDRYVDMKRLPLSEALCIDEVHTQTISYSKYSMVILDFVSGEPVDILPSRQQRDTRRYFLSIPLSEREHVKYLVTDMYNPYLAFAGTYFPNAICAIDSYHVVQWLLNKINSFLLSLCRKYEERDRLHIIKMEQENRPLKKGWKSDEVYLLKRHKWIMLKNQNNIDYTSKSRIDRHFGFYMDTYSYEERFFRIDPALEPMRNLKEKYIDFNSRYSGNPVEAQKALDRLITDYQSCSFPLFSEFAQFLLKYRQEIINSFIAVRFYGMEDDTQCYKRLSSGIIESFNRKPKDMKRNSRGFRNFSHFRNRLLFATRKEAPLLGSPKTKEEILNKTGSKRGPYKKK